MLPVTQEEGSVREKIIKIPRNSAIQPNLNPFLIFHYFNDLQSSTIRSAKFFEICYKIINLLYMFSPIRVSQKKEKRKEGKIYYIKSSISSAKAYPLAPIPRHFLRDIARDTLRKILVNKTLVILLGRGGGDRCREQSIALYSSLIVSGRWWRPFRGSWRNVAV